MIIFCLAWHLYVLMHIPRGPGTVNSSGTTHMPYSGIPQLGDGSALTGKAASTRIELVSTRSLTTVRRSVIAATNRAANSPARTLKFQTPLHAARCRSPARSHNSSTNDWRPKLPLDQKRRRAYLSILDHLSMHNVFLKKQEPVSAAFSFFSFATFSASAMHLFVVTLH